jgi:hypothetical protein
MSNVNEDIKERPDEGAFFAQWRAFGSHYVALINSVATGVLPPGYAKDIMRLHYAPIASHPAAPKGFQSYNIMEELEQKLLEDIDDAVGTAPLDQRVLAENFSRRKRLAAAEKTGGDGGYFAAAAAFGLGIALPYLVQRGYLRGEHISVTGLMALGTALFAKYMNGIAKTPAEETIDRARLSERRKRVDDRKHWLSMRAGAGMLAISALLGMISGQTPKEYNSLAKPHRALEVMPYVSSGIAFPDEAPNDR